METLIAKLVLYLSNFIVILIVLPCHEFAHAFAAVKCGDETPKFAGRYTLNPFAHFDPTGLAMMILIGFGWAKPVPVNPDNFHNRKKGCVLVSIAGVTVNIIFALLGCPLIFLASKVGIAAEWAKYINMLIHDLPVSFFSINISLFVFNLLPIYPLDGFRLYDALTKNRGKFYYFVRNKGFYILLAIFVLGYIGDWLNIPYLDIIGYLSNLVGSAIIKLWSFIL